MQMETEGGIMARADAHVARMMMDGNRTERRLLAADRTIARAYQRVLLLRRFRATCDAREHAQIEREIARELTPSWGKSIRFRVGAGIANTDTGDAGGSGSRKTGRAAAKATSSRRAIRVYQCPLLDDRGRVAIFFRVRYRGLKSKSWRPGLSADHALYILREEALENGEIVARLGPISNMGETPEEIAACWRALEVAEQAYRANATVQHRIIWNLPHGLTAEQRHEMVADYCERTFGRLGLPYVAAIHKADSKGDQRNYHAHICFSGRPCERVGAGEFEIALEKVNGLTDEAGLKRLRALACAHANAACRDAGLAVRFSHLTYKERGIDAKRQKHVGAAAMAAYDRGEKVAAVEHNENIVASNEAAYARDAAAREVALAARLVAVTRLAVANAAARTGAAAMRAGVARVADRARTMAGVERPPTSITRPAIAILARRARTVATALAKRGALSPAVSGTRRVADVASAAHRLAADQRLAVDRRARHVAAQSHLVATKARLAARRAVVLRRAEAVLLDGAVTPYAVREGCLVLDTVGMSRDDAGLVRSMDAASCAAALRERHRRDCERKAAEKLARDLALARQRDDDERHRRSVEEVCRLLLDTPHRPYRREGNVYRLDLSQMDEAGRTLIETTGTGDKAIANALRKRVKRDRDADAFDAMVSAVEKERLFVAPVDGRYVVDAAAASRFGIEPGAIDTIDAQQRLEAVSRRQQAEMMPLMMHVLGNADQIVETVDGWALSKAAPVALRQIADAWRHDARVRHAFADTLASHRRRMARLAAEMLDEQPVPVEVQRSAVEPDDRWRAARERRNQAMEAWDEVERLDGAGLPQPGRQLTRPGAKRTKPAGQAATIAQWMQGRQGSGW